MYNLADAIAVQGLLTQRSGRAADARALFDKALAEAELNAARLPEDARWQRLRFGCRLGQADLLCDENKLEEAPLERIQLSQELLGPISRLAEKDPLNVEWQHNRMTTLRLLGLWYTGLALLRTPPDKYVAQARACFDESLRISRALARDHAE